MNEDSDQYFTHAQINLHKEQFDMKTTIFDGRVITPSQNDKENPIRSCIDENNFLIQQSRKKPAQIFLNRLIPDAATRLGREAELDELETGFDYRQRALQMAVESKLQAVEEACNHVLVTGKSEIRRERQEFFAAQVDRLASSMHTYAEKFNAEIDRRLGDLNNKYKNEVIRQKEEERLYRQIDDFHSVLEDMASEFRQIINEGVHADGKPSKRNRA